MMYDMIDLANRLQAPSIQHLLGTDALGRDVLLRTLIGTIPTLFVGIITTAMAAIIGSYLALCQSRLIIRLSEMTLVIPHLLWVMMFVASFGYGTIVVTIALILTSWPFWVQLANSMIEKERRKEYVEAAIVMGYSETRIRYRHILPNILPVLVAQMPIQAANNILIFAGLSFLGLGASPTTPELGRMIYEGKDFLESWWISLFPGMMLFGVLMMLMIISRWYRGRYCQML